MKKRKLKKLNIQYRFAGIYLPIKSDIYALVERLWTRLHSTIPFDYKIQSAIQRSNPEDHE